MLSPYGYKLHNSLFYREVNQEQCFFFIAKKNPHYSQYSVYFDVLPYCIDLESELEEIHDIPDMLEFELTSFIQELVPSLFQQETAVTYYRSRSYADPYDEEGTLDCLQNVCSDIKRYVLPYLHQFVDLQYYYDEENKKGSWNFASPERYGLSLKLHRYEDALQCVEYRISDCHRIMADYVQTQNRLHTGILMDRDNVILKNNPNYAEDLTKWIADCAEKIATYEKIQNHILHGSTTELDKMVTEIEERSRIHLKRLLNANF